MIPALVRDATVVLIDDVASNLRLLESSLRAFGLTKTRGFSDSRAGLEWLQNNPWDLLLMDLDMPSPNGFEILEALGGGNGVVKPVIIITALSDTDSRRRGLELGAADYLSKPLDLPELILRVRNTLALSQASRSLRLQRDLLEEEVYERTRQLDDSHVSAIASLARAAAYKDDDTGSHTQRIGVSAALLARAHGQSDEWVERIRLAAPMHDIGKIGIPDSILGKPGRLDDDERTLMNDHARIGHDILRNYENSPLMQLAAEIALHHHEKWDGSGYPNGIAGEKIPLAARIVALCDVYDALRSPRPYKRPWSLDQVQDYLHQQAGRHFDPQLVTLFFGLIDHLEDPSHEDASR